MKLVIMRMQTRKVFLDVILFALLMQFALFAITPAANAASGVTLSELSSNDVAILPGNPFYFFIKWRKGLQEWFIDDEIESAMFELQVLGRKAAELKKIYDFKSRNRVFLTKAVEDYQAAAVELESRLTAVSAAELSSAKNSRFSSDAALSLLTNRLFAHLRFAKDLREMLSGNEYDTFLNTLESALAQSLIHVESDLDTEEDFTARVLSLAQALDEQGKLSSLVTALERVNGEEQKESGLAIRFAVRADSIWEQLMDAVQAQADQDMLEF